MFRVDALGNWKRLIKLVDYWELRSSMLQLVATRRIVEIFLDRLKTLIPKEMEAYRDSLKIVQVDGLEEGISYAIVSEIDRKDANELDMDTTAVYIVNKSRSKLLQILEEFSPWTLDTLPLGFDTNDADIVYRDVTAGEVLRLRDQNRSTLMNIRDELIRHGADLSTSARTADIQALPDMAFMALRLEMGIGVKRVPHWSKTINGLNKWIRNDFVKSGIFYDYLANDRFNKHHETVSDDLIRKDDFEKKFNEFQQKMAEL